LTLRVDNKQIETHPNQKKFVYQNSSGRSKGLSDDYPFI
jgi:hypothetical protein